MQLQTYKKSEETLNGFYVIIDVGSLRKKYEKLLEMYNNDCEKKSEIFYIDGHKKLSASKRKSRDTIGNFDLSEMNSDFSEVDLTFPDIEIPNWDFHLPDNWGE